MKTCLFMVEATFDETKTSPEEVAKMASLILDATRSEESSFGEFELWDGSVKSLDEEI